MTPNQPTTPEKRVETPRTDAAETTGGLTWSVPSSFARQLEQELQQAKEEYTSQRMLKNSALIELEKTKEQLQQVREELAILHICCDEEEVRSKFFEKSRDNLQSQLSQWQECAKFIESLLRAARPQVKKEGSKEDTLDCWIDDALKKLSKLSTPQTTEARKEKE